MDDIVKTCDEKGIKLIFFTVPWKGQNNYSVAMSEYAKKQGCTYLDLFYHIEQVGVSSDFYDDGHLNNTGAKKTADFLGAYLKENYELEDMRLVENNLWEDKIDNKTGIYYTEWYNKKY